VSENKNFNHFSTEDCQFATGGSFIEFDLTKKTELSSPPILTILVILIFYLNF